MNGPSLSSPLLTIFAWRLANRWNLPRRRTLNSCSIRVRRSDASESGLADTCVAGGSLKEVDAISWKIAAATGLEPATYCVTGRRSNQAELRPRI